jgi:protein TonB
MTADPLAMPPTPPEWRHSGRYFVVALVVHVGVIALPLGLLPKRPAALPTVNVTLEPSARVAEPAALPLPAVEPAAPPPAAEKRTRRPPLLDRSGPTIAPPPANRVAAFSVAEPERATTEPRQAPVAAPAAASLIAPRYDAAYLNNPAPAYPALSRRLGEEGKVLLKVRVSAEGSALAVNLEKSSNFERLDEAARAAVAYWRFVPARRGDQAVESSVVVPLVFRLDG